MVIFMLYLLPIIHTPRSTESSLHSRSRTVHDKGETYNRAYTSSDNGIRDGEAALTTMKQGQQSRDGKQEVSGGGVSSVGARVHPRVDKKAESALWTRIANPQSTEHNTSCRTAHKQRGFCDSCYSGIEETQQELAVEDVPSFLLATWMFVSKIFINVSSTAQSFGGEEAREL